jgi:proline iminopeptidase
MRIGWLVAGWALGRAVRRLSQRTGVTDAEAFGTLPGDDVIPHPMVEWTRGVTVHAAPERIWPWLVQMGYGRAGWYTPAWVDRILEPSLFQLKTPSPRSPERLLPEFQSLAVGDIIADGPDYRSYWRVLAVEPQQAIVYRSIRHPWLPHPFDPSDPAAVGRVEAQLIAGGVYLDSTWTFVLRAVAAETTRLLVRTRGNYAPGLLGLGVPAIGLYDATYGMAQLRAIAHRAEALATTPSTAKQHDHHSDRPQCRRNQ